MTTYETAISYVQAGLSVIPIKPDGSKSPALPWNQFRNRLPTNEEIQQWFGYDSAYGIAVICGKVSGNLVVLDFESQAAYDHWLETAGLISREFGFRPEQWPIASTPGGGVHVYYRSREPVKGNRKLAMTADGGTLIETRGEGGYVLAPGSPGECHPSGLAYQWLNKGWLNHG